jgi:hypothetical protein
MVLSYWVINFWKCSITFELSCIKRGCWHHLFPSDLWSAWDRRVCKVTVRGLQGLSLITGSTRGILNLLPCPEGSRAHSSLLCDREKQLEHEATCELLHRPTLRFKHDGEWVMVCCSEGDRATSLRYCKVFSLQMSATCWLVKNQQHVFTVSQHHAHTHCSQSFNSPNFCIYPNIRIQYFPLIHHLTNGGEQVTLHLWTNLKIFCKCIFPKFEGGGGGEGCLISE